MFCQSCAVDSPADVFCSECRAFLPAASVGVQAGTTRRLLALVLDCALGVLFCILFLLTFSGATHVGIGFATVEVALVVFSASVLRGLTFGQTPGKMALQLRTVNRADGRIPSLGRMLLRETAGKALGFISLGLGFAPAFRTPHGQTWHDRMARTAVVLDDPAMVGPETPLRSRALWPLGPVLAIVLLLFVALAPFPQAHHAASSNRLVANADGLFTPNAAPPVDRAKPSAGKTLPVGDVDSLPAVMSDAALPTVDPAPPAPAAVSVVHPAQPTPAAVPKLRPFPPAPVAVAAHRFAPPATAAFAANSRTPDHLPLNASRAPAVPITAATQAARVPGTTLDPRIGVDQTLTGWARAMAHNDPSEISGYYADHLDRYFLVRDVSNRFVHQDKAAFFRSGKSLFRFRLDQVRMVRAEPGRVEVAAVKEWILLDRARTGGRIGSTQSRIWLSQINGAWKITGEQDLF